MNQKPLLASTLATDDVAAAAVRYRDLRGEGSAKRHPNDVPDRDVGLDLAVGRALIDLGRQVLADAGRRVAAADARRRNIPTFTYTWEFVPPAWRPDGIVDDTITVNDTILPE